jgi:hypothetical protein
VWSDPRSDYEHLLQGATLGSRHADPLLPNIPSCGNQPANISLTARRTRHAHQPGQRRSTQLRPHPPSGAGPIVLPLDSRPLHINSSRSSPAPVATVLARAQRDQRRRKAPPTHGTTRGTRRSPWRPVSSAPAAATRGSAALDYVGELLLANAQRTAFLEIQSSATSPRQPLRPCSRRISAQSSTVATPCRP